MVSSVPVQVMVTVGEHGGTESVVDVDHRNARCTGRKHGMERGVPALGNAVVVDLVGERGVKLSGGQKARLSLMLADALKSGNPEGNE